MNTFFSYVDISDRVCELCDKKLESLNFMYLPKKKLHFRQRSWQRRRRVGTELRWNVIQILPLSHSSELSQSHTHIVGRYLSFSPLLHVSSSVFFHFRIHILSSVDVLVSKPKERDDARARNIFIFFYLIASFVCVDRVINKVHWKSKTWTFSHKGWYKWIYVVEGSRSVCCDFESVQWTFKDIWEKLHEYKTKKFLI